MSFWQTIWSISKKIEIFFLKLINFSNYWISISKYFEKNVFNFSKTTINYWKIEFLMIFIFLLSNQFSKKYLILINSTIISQKKILKIYEIWLWYFRFFSRSNTRKQILWTCHCRFICEKSWKIWTITKLNTIFDLSTIYFSLMKYLISRSRNWIWTNNQYK